MLLSSQGNWRKPSVTVHAPYTTPAAQRIGNLSHGGSLSRSKTPRRSPRSSSARTASDRDIERSWAHAPRKPLAVLLAPLSQRCAQKSASPCRQRTGSVTSQSTSSVKPLETEKRTRKHTPRTHTHLRRIRSNHWDSLIRTHARDCASLLLWNARQSIEQTTTLTWNTRTLFIMDMVLDLRVEYDDDTLIELLQRRRQDVGSIYTHAVYTFEDEQSLAMYWADQAAMWSGMRTTEPGSSTRFPDSDERSTASRTAALNGGLLMLFVLSSIRCRQGLL